MLQHIPKSNDDLSLALYESFLMARRGKMDTVDEHKFDLNYVANLMMLTTDIIRGTYHPIPGKAFVTFNPVIREIFAAQLRDRVVHHLLYALNGFFLG